MKQQSITKIFLSVLLNDCYCCRVFIGDRLGKCKIQARGIFPGAQVKKGPDWDWGDQDGGPQGIDLVLDVRG